jgi:hypothetical protein
MTAQPHKMQLTQSFENSHRIWSSESENRRRSSLLVQENAAEVCYPTLARSLTVSNSECKFKTPNMIYQGLFTLYLISFSYKLKIKIYFPLPTLAPPNRPGNQGPERLKNLSSHRASEKICSADSCVTLCPLYITYNNRLILWEIFHHFLDGGFLTAGNISCLVHRTY